MPLHLAERDEYDHVDRGSHMDDEQDRKPTASPFPPQAFDPRDEYSVVERRLPHWSQAGAIAFITWRTWDSMPAKVIDTRLAERDEILKRLGAPVLVSLREMKEHLAEQDEYERALQKLPENCAGRQAGGGGSLERTPRRSARRVRLAAPGSGAHRRRQPETLSRRSLLLTDYVVMPNHVHLLAAFPDDAAMLAQCDSWNTTRAEINRLLGRKGAPGKRTASTTWLSPEDFERIGGTLPRIRPAHACVPVSIFMSGWRYRRRGRLCAMQGNPAQTR